MIRRAAAKRLFAGTCHTDSSATGTAQRWNAHRPCILSWSTRAINVQIRRAGEGTEFGPASWTFALQALSALAVAATVTSHALCYDPDPDMIAPELEEMTKSPEKVAAKPRVPKKAVWQVLGTYNANNPVEDRSDTRKGNTGDMFVSVYDGHGGWQCAEFARKRLITITQAELENSLARTPQQVKNAITQSFMRVEREYMCQVKAAFDIGFGNLAKTGACAIMALVREGRLYVANAGDCRAVLGRRNDSSTGKLLSGETALSAVAMSNDHNAREQFEQEKLRRLHPFEDDVFCCRKSSSCYVKDRLQPTRAFGDAYLKYSEFNGQAGQHRSVGRYLPPPYTPPYITVEPEIFVHDIDGERDKFVILGTDGLWDYVSSDEAVDIVQQVAYLERKPELVADRLIERVLQCAADRYHVSLEALKDVAAGPKRRGMHDDVTCVVLFLNGGVRKSSTAEVPTYGPINRPSLPPAQ